MRRIGALACGFLASLIAATSAVAMPPLSDSYGDLFQSYRDCDGYWLTITFRNEVTRTVFFDQEGQPTKEHFSVDYDLRVSVYAGELFEGEQIAFHRDVGQYNYTFFLTTALVGQVGTDLRITIPEVGLIVISTGPTLFNVESGRLIESSHRTSIGQVDWCSVFAP